MLEVELLDLGFDVDRFRVWPKAVMGEMRAAVQRTSTSRFKVHLLFVRDVGVESKLKLSLAFSQAQLSDSRARLGRVGCVRLLE